MNGVTRRDLLLHTSTTGEGLRRGEQGRRSPASRPGLH
jgi:hypothetical protein